MDGNVGRVPKRWVQCLLLLTKENLICPLFVFCLVSQTNSTKVRGEIKLVSLYNL